MSKSVLAKSIASKLKEKLAFDEAIEALFINVLINSNKETLNKLYKFLQSQERSATTITTK
jgi:hypothetical protein